MRVIYFHLRNRTTGVYVCRVSRPENIKVSDFIKDCDRLNCDAEIIKVQ